MKKVVVFGATGLTGRQLIKILNEDPSFQDILLISREKIDNLDKKFKTAITHDFSIKNLSKLVKGCDVVFSLIGTTQKKVNWDKKKYRDIDFKINYNIALASKKNLVRKLILVSSSGANLKSQNFYLKLKAEIESEISKLEIKNFVTLRPSLLLGRRKEFRFFEKIAQLFMPMISFILPNEYKPVSAFKVAKTMVYVSKLNQLGNIVISNKDILQAN